MRLFLLILALGIAGCGGAAPIIPSYRALTLTHNGAGQVSRMYCAQELPVNGITFGFGYERVEYSDGETLVTCMVSDDHYFSDSKTYYASEAGVFDGSCAVHLAADSNGVGTWTYAVSGATASATYANAASPANGAVASFTGCTTR
jgi:hypothetical protein